MRKILFPLTVVLIIAALTALPAGAITWGEEDTTHVNVGAMVVDWPDYGLWHLCSGTLIQPRVFLTAGHCTQALVDYGIETVWVNFEPYALAEGGLRLVEKAYTHPNFIMDEHNMYDVGLLVLAEEVTDIAPAILTSAGFLDELLNAGELRSGPAGAKFTLVGYGQSLSWPPHELLTESTRRVSVAEYIALTDPLLHLSMNINKDDGGACHGDSGGPVFYPLADGSEILVAIISKGDGGCMSTSFNYRADIPDSLDYIESVIATLEQVDRE